MLRYVASLPFDSHTALPAAPVYSELPLRCPTLAALLEDYVSSHQLGVFALLVAFGVGSGFSLGLIAGISWGAGRSFATGSYRLFASGVSPGSGYHPRLAGYSPQ